MSLHIMNKDNKDIAEAVLLPGDPLRAKFIAETYLESPKCYNEIRGMLGYTGLYKGVKVSVQGSGMGAPSMGIYSYELIHHCGVQRLIRVGTAGSFHEKIKIHDIVLALNASTDSNYAHTYEVNGQFSPCASWDLIQKAKTAADTMNKEIHAGNVVTCDVFYEFNQGWWKKWAELGVLCVEMETAALYMNASVAGVDALSILTMSDHFVTGDKSSPKEREQSFTDMMEIALETATA
jgi:purine-nucleoside phosphorylase